MTSEQRLKVLEKKMDLVIGLLKQQPLQKKQSLKMRIIKKRIKTRVYAKEMILKLLESRGAKLTSAEMQLELEDYHNIKRTTFYNSLREIKNEGLVSEYPETKIIYIVRDKINA